MLWFASKLTWKSQDLFSASCKESEVELKKVWACLMTHTVCYLNHTTWPLTSSKPILCLVVQIQKKNLFTPISTVPCRLNRLFGHLWSKVGVLWRTKKRLKSAPKRFFFLYLNRYGLDLSKEVLQVLPDQRTAKLQALKVCTGRESNPGRPESCDYYIK